MVAYLVHFIDAFLPVALVTGVLAPLHAPVDVKRWMRPLGVALVCGVLGGIAVYLGSRHQGMLTSARTSLHGAGLAVAVINAAALPLLRKGGRSSAVAGAAALIFTAVLAAAASYRFIAYIAEQALSSSTVINTELILNVGAILAGLALVLCLLPLTTYLGRNAGRGVTVAVLLIASLLLAIQWGGDLLLGMMRLEIVQLTSLRVSIVAKTNKYSAVFPYVHGLLVLLLALAYYLRRTKVTGEELAEMGKAARRKMRGRVMFEMRWFWTAVALVLAAFSVLLYHDLYASRPPRISKPLQLQPDNQGMIRVKVEDLADGSLHRFAHVTEDGHVVRFFMLNRSGGKKIGVVYDACMMCGDMGYVQEKNEVICIACNVRIFIPSIGKAGGCNPIPLVHKVENGYVVVAAEELDKGAKYFSEVVTVKVKDPVTGKELVSRDAAHRYEYQGRTYFFESEASLEKFKTAPEQYVGQRESRYFRVQGFKGA